MINQTSVTNNLVFYFKLLFKKSGMQFDSDNRAEITEIVNLIYEDLEEFEKGNKIVITNLQASDKALRNQILSLEERLNNFEDLCRINNTFANSKTDKINNQMKTVYAWWKI